MYYEKFRELCERARVTPGQVAKATGVASSTLTEWKKGRYTPKVDKLQLIADYFNVPLDELMSSEKVEFYFDAKTAAIAQKFYQRSDLVLLFEAAEDAPPEDVELAYQMLKALKAKEGKK